MNPRILFWCVICLNVGCAATFHRGYEGPERAHEDLSFVRVSHAPGSSWHSLSTHMVSPLTGKSIRSGRALDQGWQWLTLEPGGNCIEMRTVGSNCITPLTGQCISNSNAVHNQKVCFSTHAGKQYEIQTLAELNRDCYAGMEVTGYRASELESGKTVGEWNVSGYCKNYVAHRVAEWAQHFTWRGGNVVQRSMWSSVNKAMLKRWRRSPDYQEWWATNHQQFDQEFVSYVEESTLTSPP